MFDPNLEKQIGKSHKSSELHKNKSCP